MSKYVDNHDDTPETQDEIQDDAVHWHMLVWVKASTIPDGAIMAEFPIFPSTDSEEPHMVGLYLCKVVLKMQMHGQCVPR